MQSSELIIEQAVSEDWISHLSFFYYVKCRYSNSTIFDYSTRKASRKLNMTASKIHGHISALQEKGLIVSMTSQAGTDREKINLTFKKISEKHKCTLFITKNDTLKNIEHKLRFKLFEKRHRQQLFAVRKKSEARSILFVKFPTKGEIKKLRKFESLPPEKRKIDYKITFTDKILAKMQNVSDKTAQALKKAWRDLGYICYQSVKVKIAKVGKFLKEAVNYGEFVFQGYLWKVEPTQYVVLVAYQKGTNKQKEEGNFQNRVAKYLKKQNLIRKAA